MKAIELRDKADVELRERLAEIRGELFQAQFRGGQDEVEERGRFRKLRREVAQIQTILRERELGIRDQKAVASSESE
ncbi:MAG: 50S ribosomal protein L29 [Planctomycetota bacterium]